MTCPDCKYPMVKIAIQNEEAEWGVYWGCDCKLDKDLPIELAGDKVDVLIYVHNGRCCDLERGYNEH